jgi:hypothetical protein
MLGFYLEKKQKLKQKFAEHPELIIELSMMAKNLTPPCEIYSFGLWILLEIGDARLDLYLKPDYA